ncbi:MAG TPA: hypothetical protein PLQ76_03765, partial [bacterium]|nr:hypothetical protein [bacterium]
VMFMVPDTIPPAVPVLDSYMTGVTFSGYPYMMGYATDSAGVVKTFELYIDNAKAVSASAFLGGYDYLNNPTYNFSLPWNTLSYTDGAHTLKVKAIDGGGNSSWSSTYNVTVNNTSVGSFSGTVSNMYSGGLTNAKVAAYYQVGSPGMEQPVIAAIAAVGSGGAYSASNIVANTYNAFAFIDANGNNYPDDNEMCGPYSGQITVTSGANIQNVNIAISTSCYYMFNSTP